MARIAILLSVRLGRQLRYGGYRPWRAPRSLAQNAKLADNLLNVTLVQVRILRRNALYQIGALKSSRACDFCSATS